MMFAKISTARSFLLGPILDADGVAKTDEVVASIKVTKNGTVGAAHGSSTLTHNHTGHYVYAANAGDFDTAGEVEFSLNSGTNAMAPVTFQVLPAVNFDALFATAPGAATGLMIAGSNAATTFATLDVTGACTHGSTVLGNVTAGTVTQTGAASWGATALASMAVTGALSVGTTTTLTGAVSCGSTFDVVGALTAGSVSIDTTMDVVGALTCASFGVDGALSVGTTTTLTGAVSLGSTLGVTGTTTLAAVTQVGAVSLGATTIASLDVTGLTRTGTLTVTGATTLAAVGMTTLSTSGATTFNSLVVSTTTALTGAVTAPAGITANITGNLVGTVTTVTTTGTTTNLTNLPAAAATAAELAKVPKSDSTVSWNATALAAIQAECNAACLDVVNVDTLVDGNTIAVGLAIAAAGVLGKVSGAGTGTEVFVGLNGSTTRATVTVDSSGNRTAVTY